VTLPFSLAQADMAIIVVIAVVGGLWLLITLCNKLRETLSGKDTSL
jgi:hypothetical protein